MKQKLLSLVAASALLIGMSSVNAAENPFAMHDMQKSQQLSMSSSGGKCMGGGDDKAAKCSGGGKCGDAKKKAAK